MKIDLGSRRTFEVSIGGVDYQILEPTAAQVSSLKTMIGDQEEKSFEVCGDLFCELGLSKEAWGLLTVSQAQKIIEVVLGVGNG